MTAQLNHLVDSEEFMICFATPSEIKHERYILILENISFITKNIPRYIFRCDYNVFITKSLEVY
jgi:hypothetical protein